MGIFRYESAGLTVIGPCSCGGSLCARGGRIDAEAFFTETASGGGREWHGMVFGPKEGCVRGSSSEASEGTVQARPPSPLDMICMDGHVFALRGYRLKWKWREMEVQTWYAFAIVLEGSLVRLGWENIIVWDFGHRSIDRNAWYTCITIN